MGNFSDRPIDEEEAGEFLQFGDRGREMLDIPLELDPKAVAAVIDAQVDAIQQDILETGEKLSQDEATVIALSLGSLYGDQIGKVFGWTWRCVVDEEDERYGLISESRSLAIYPTMFIKECLDDPEIDCTLMLAFNMLDAGRFDAMPAAGYVDVLAEVVRVVPRR